MSLGLGHSYWVEIIRFKHGTLEECIKFMQEYPFSNVDCWWELSPIVRKDKKTKKMYLHEYRVQLVKEVEHGKDK